MEGETVGERMGRLRWIYICAFDRVSRILRLGVWESAGLWVESDAPKLSSVSVPGSVTSAPWENKGRKRMNEDEEDQEKRETMSRISITARHIKEFGGKCGKCQEGAK